MKVYITVLALLILVGVFLAGRSLVRHKESPTLPDHQAALLTPMLPSKGVVIGDPCDPVVPCVQRVFELHHHAPAPVDPLPLELPQPSETPPPAAVFFEQTPQEDTLTPVPALEQPAVSAVPVSFVYLFNSGAVPLVSYSGVPAQLSTAPTKTVPIVYSTAPSFPSWGTPVFIPQVVPSRVGMPRLIYPNGVVIKPKVYYPSQPVRNSFRAITP